MLDLLDCFTRQVPLVLSGDSSKISHICPLFPRDEMTGAGYREPNSLRYLEHFSLSYDERVLDFSRMNGSQENLDNARSPTSPDRLERVVYRMQSHPDPRQSAGDNQMASYC